MFQIMKKPTELYDLETKSLCCKIGSITSQLFAKMYKFGIIIMSCENYKCEQHNLKVFL